MKMISTKVVQRLQLWGLLMLVLGLAAGIAEQSHRLSRARMELVTVQTKRMDDQKKAEQESFYRELQKQQAEAFDQHQEKIPYVDGYVWISKFLREAAPGLQLTVHPPEMNRREIIDIPEFCTGTFRIRGTGGSEDLLHLLRKIEGDLPFTHVQDIHFSFTDDKRLKVQFSLSLLTLMRLHEASQPTIQAATANLRTASR